MPAPPNQSFITVSADSLLARMQSLFGPQLEKTSIRLNLESVPDIWVRADPHQMEQVLINLIQNAAESIEREAARSPCAPDRHGAPDGPHPCRWSCWR